MTKVSKQEQREGAMGKGAKHAPLNTGYLKLITYDRTNSKYKGSSKNSSPPFYFPYVANSTVGPFRGRPCIYCGHAQRWTRSWCEFDL